jgi:hypothetical protein
MLEAPTDLAAEHTYDPRLAERDDPVIAAHREIAERATAGIQYRKRIA